MIKKFTIAFSIVFFLLFCGWSSIVTPELSQGINNELWAMKYNPAASKVYSVTSWIPCVGLLAFGLWFLFVITKNAVSDVGGAYVKMRIGKEEPEPMFKDKNGYIVAYRYYRIDDKNNLYSMTSEHHHAGGYLQADQKPTLGNTNGIYAAKRPNSSILNEYAQPGTALVEVRLWGEYVEGTKGYRAEHCQAQRILKVIPPSEPKDYKDIGDANGYW